MFKKTGISSLTAFVLLTLVAPEIGQAIRLPSQGERMAQVRGVGWEREQFPLPNRVAADTHIKIDGSPTMVVVNDTLKQQFESEFANTRVDIAANGTESALERLLAGEVDLVAVGRPLTQAERDRGLEQVTLEREKLAIIIGPDNPFDGDLTFSQFAQIFRGEITDWSEVGGEPGPIKFVDRPENSDTRLAFSLYKAFVSAPFVSGPATVRVDNDETQEVIAALGDNGISYAVASHVLGLDTVKLVPMHKTLPDNPAYPYSQPRAYVYQEPANEAVTAFLGYGLADPGQTAIALAQETEAQAIASGLSLIDAVSSSSDVDDPTANTEADTESGGGNGEDSATTPPEENGDAIASTNGGGEEDSGTSVDADGNAVGADGATSVGGDSPAGTDGAESSSGDGTGAIGEGQDNNGAGNEAPGNETPGNEGSQPQANGDTGSGTTDSSSGTEGTPSAPNQGEAGAEGQLPMWLWWLLPLGVLGLLLWGLMGRKNVDPTDNTVEELAPDEIHDSPEAETVALVSGTDMPHSDRLSSDSQNEMASSDEMLEVSDAEEDVMVPDHGAVGAGIDSHQDEHNGHLGMGMYTGPAIVTSAALGAGLSFLKAGRIRNAQASLDEAITQNPDDVVAWTLQGQTFAGAGKWDQALESYDRALAIDPDSPVALAGKGVAFTQKGQPEVAIAFYDQALESHDQNDSSTFLDAGLPLLAGTALTAAIVAAKSKALAHIGHSTEAISGLNRASNLNPDDADLWTVKGNTLASLEQTDGALASYDRAIERRAYSPAAYLGKGNVLSTIPSRTKEALNHYEWAATLTHDGEEGDTREHPPDPLPSVEPSVLAPLLVGGVAAGAPDPVALRAKALAGQGRLLVEMGQKDLQKVEQSPETSFLEASLFGEENVTAVPADDPPSFTSDDSAGQAQVGQGLAKFEEAIATNPDDPALYVERSMALATLGDRQGAMASIEQAESLRPDHPIIQLYKGHVLMQLDQPSDALAAYETSLNLEEKHPNAILAQATAFDTLGHHEEAIITFNRLIDEENPPSTALMTQADHLGLPLLGSKALRAQALSGKGNALISLGYTGAGLDNVQQAVNTDPTNAQCWISQGNALRLANQPDAAIASFERALELDPNSTEALLGKGNGLMLLNKGDEAQSYFNQAASLGDDLSGIILPADDDDLVMVDSDVVDSDVYEADDDDRVAMDSDLYGASAYGANAMSKNAAGGDSSLDGTSAEKRGSNGVSLDDPPSIDASNGNGLNDNREYGSTGSSELDTLDLDTSGPDTSEPDVSELDTSERISLVTDAATPGLMTALGIGAVGIGSKVIERRTVATPKAPPAAPPETPPEDSSEILPELPSENDPEIASKTEQLGSESNLLLDSFSSPIGDSSLQRSRADLADVDEGLSDLPKGYGESRIVLLPHDPQWVYTYWDISNEHKQALRQQGGTQLVLRLCDVTGVDLEETNIHSMQQFECDELAQNWYLPIAVSDRDYVTEIGYVTPDERWLMLARSQPVRVPPSYPSDWTDEQFISVDWDEPLTGQPKVTLVPPESIRPGPLQKKDGAIAIGLNHIQAMRQAGSLWGSMHPVPQQTLSSFLLPSSVDLAMRWPSPLALDNSSGIRSRKFWLMADAELIVHGATAPDATVTIDGQPIALNPDGSFRVHVPFKNGVIDYPIVAVAADGEHTRSIRMTFERDTPHDITNTKAGAEDANP